MSEKSPSETSSLSSVPVSKTNSSKKEEEEENNNPKEKQIVDGFISSLFEEGQEPDNTDDKEKEVVDGFVTSLFEEAQDQEKNNLNEEPKPRDVESSALAEENPTKQEIIITITCI